MATKTRAVKSPSKVMETLSNAASLFQTGNVNMLASNTGMPIDGTFLRKNSGGASSGEKRIIPIVRSTIMCPW